MINWRQIERMHNRWLEPPDDPEPEPERPDEDWRWEDEKIEKADDER